MGAGGECGGRGERGDRNVRARLEMVREGREREERINGRVGKNENRGERG